MSIGSVAFILAQSTGPERAELIYTKPLENIWWGLPTRQNHKASSGNSFFKVLVMPDGKPMHCVILVTSGNKELDRDICDYVKNEFRYRPARDMAGQPTFGVIEGLVNLVDRETRQVFRTEADYAIDVSRLPKNGTAEQEVSVDVQVDEAGRLQSCAVPKTYISASQSGPHHMRLPEPVAVLSGIACGELPKIWDVMPERGAEGRPISYVRQVRILFRAPPRVVGSQDAGALAKVR